MAALTSTVSAGDVLSLIVGGKATTRAEIAHATGLSRSTVGERLDSLFSAGLVKESHDMPSSGGRRSKALTLNPDSRTVIAADIGEDHVRLVVTDLAGSVLNETVAEMSISEGPQVLTAWIVERGVRLLEELGRSASELSGIGLAVPAPVDFRNGEVTAPSVMTGWEGVDIAGLIQATLDVPVIVENDVNARGLGEYLLSWSTVEQVFYVKAGTGIGSAILTGGTLFRGAQGAAGDIGHIRLDPTNGPLCRCGNIGCVEADAAGWSLVRELRARGFEVNDTRQVMDLVANNSPEAIQLLRQAGRTLGRAIAYSVNLLNPSVVVIGGSLTLGGDHLLMGIRESVYQYSLPLATRDLQISVGRGDARSGAVGVAHLVIRHALEPDRVNAGLKTLLVSAESA